MLPIGDRRTRTRNCGCSTRRLSHLNSCAGTPNFRKTIGGLHTGAGAALSIPWTPRRLRSPNAGGCDFAPELPDLPATAAQWTAKALPRVVTITDAPDELVNPELGLPPRLLSAIARAAAARALTLGGTPVRVEFLNTDGPYAVLLPLDRLFEIRVATALRLWHGLGGRRTPPDAGALTQERRKRFILALRALDARLLGTTYPDIAAGLFETAPITKRDWISHELRDQTGRLVRLGFEMMKGGYRQLVLYPYRRHI